MRQDEYDEIIAGILRVEAQNDRSDWHAVPKPPLGETMTPILTLRCTCVRCGHVWLFQPLPTVIMDGRNSACPRCRHHVFTVQPEQTKPTSSA